MKSAISNQTQNIVASNEALARGFEYGLEQISGEIAELRAAFDYSMGLALEQLRIQTRTLEGILDQLDAIHETLQHPLLTQARELSKIGMDNLSKGLLQEGLESLLASVEKYKADFLVQLQIGKLYLYGKNATDDMIDLPNAKEHLLLAARYANSEISSLPDAAKFCAEAFLHSAITCYAQANEKWLAGDVDAAKRFTEEALELSQNATQVYPQLAEAFYNHAKFAALLNDGENTVNSLKTAILTDRNYCLKADADKDFDGVREYVRNLFESLYEQAKNEATKAFEPLKDLLENYVFQGEAKQAEAEIRKLFGQAEPLYHKDTYFDYLDALPLLKKATFKIKIRWKGIISRQEFEQQEKRRIEAEREAEQQRKKAEAEAERQRKEQELRDYRLKNKLCLECGEKLGFWDKLSGAQYCKRHRK